MIIESVVVFGSLIDLILTYNYLKIYKEKFPTKDYTIIEANPLVRYCIRKSGLREGVFNAGAIIIVILLFLVFFIPVNFRYFLAGCYYMMVTFHLTNLLALKRINQKEVKNELDKKFNTKKHRRS